MSGSGNSERGQSLIELVIAFGIGVAMLGVASGALFLVLRSSQLAEQHESAAQLASSLTQNLSSLTEANWHNLYGLNKGSANHYWAATSSGALVIQSGDQQIIAGNTSYTVYFYADNVSRGANGDIEAVYSGSNDDPSTQKVTAVASWSIGGSVPNVTQVSYLTRWRNSVFRQTDWFGGAGQEGPITPINNKFTSQTNVDFTTALGSIVPVTTNLNNVYVADMDNDRIQKFNDSGTFLLKWGTAGTGNGQFKKPFGVAIDSLNNVYIVDKDNHRVQKFDSNGNFLFTWGTDGQGDGEFGHPQGIAIDSANNIYVVDVDRDRIQKFDANGNFLLKWGTNGSGDGQFKKPNDVAADSLNNVYVTDQDNNRVQKFDSNGNFILKWGTNGTGDGQFRHPRGLEQIAANCSNNCILTSSIFDTGVSGGASLNTIMWQGDQPFGTAVKFQIASSNSSSGPWNYLGSDGSGSGYYAPAGPNVQMKIRSADHNNKRYFRSKKFFDIAGASVPRVDDVIINWSR